MRRYRRRLYRRRRPRRGYSRSRMVRRRYLRRRRPPVVRMSRRQRLLRRPELKKLKSEIDDFDLTIADASANEWHLSQLAHTWITMDPAVFAFEQSLGSGSSARVGNQITFSRIRCDLSFGMDPIDAAGITSALGQFWEIHVFLLLNRDWGQPTDDETGVDTAIPLPDLGDLSVYTLADDGFTADADNTAMTINVPEIAFGLGTNNLRGSTTKVLAARKLFLKVDPVATGRHRVVLKTSRPIRQTYLGTAADAVGHNRISLAFYNRGSVRKDPTSSTIGTGLFAKWNVTGRISTSWTDA